MSRRYHSEPVLDWEMSEDGTKTTAQLGDEYGYELECTLVDFELGDRTTKMWCVGKAVAVIDKIHCSDINAARAEAERRLLAPAQKIVDLFAEAKKRKKGKK